MPEASPPTKFIQSIKTGRTDTTKKLDGIFVNPASLRTHPRFAQNAGDNLQASGILDTLRSWAEDLLRAAPQGLGPGEIAHINGWPKEQKERVRQALVSAIVAGRTVHFVWELYGGSDEATEILDYGQGDVTIIFRSPSRNVDVNAAATDVTVRVGPPAKSG